MPDLPDPVRLVGATVVVGPTRFGFESECMLEEQHRVRYVLVVDGNCYWTYETPYGLDWRGARLATHPWVRAHGRWEEWHKVQVVEL